METFRRTHNYLVEHTHAPVRRNLMDEIDWTHRLIGIKGTRGVGKTTFLLQYAQETFGTDRCCMYINMNNFYFTQCSLVKFAGQFVAEGGKVLLIDQMFKYHDWSKELRQCYEKYPELKIVFTGSSVMRLKEENPVLRDIVDVYHLRGFSFREYLNLQSGSRFPAYSLDDLLHGHEHLAHEILQQVNPLDYFQDYLHHGFYPFFLEKRNFSENLLKTMNMMIEVDILLIKQIELKYLTKIKRLFYLIASEAPSSPNVSRLAELIHTSRATVMNYIKYMADARLINMVYPMHEGFPKKPTKLLMHNTNLMYAIYPANVKKIDLYDTFFFNALYKDHRLHVGEKGMTFLIDDGIPFKINTYTGKQRIHPDILYALNPLAEGKDNKMPLWLFGFLY